MDNIEGQSRKGRALEGMTSMSSYWGVWAGWGQRFLVDVFSIIVTVLFRKSGVYVTRSGGGLGEAGSVNWQFEQKGVIGREVTDGMSVDDVSLMAIDAGAEDVKVDKDYIEIYTSLEDMEKIRKSLEGNGITVKSAEMAKVAKNTIQLDEATSLQVLKLIDRLENLDDVRNVWSNVEFSDAVLEKYEG
jgi:transcriptional/translational regulatory protein YebC/TACO1